ncbi:MAG: hypothetical protein OQJ81_13510 [Melioribacteraceae bacterium]|nr:hypothetical protein [Melioribacteraceae bacterium]
MKRTNLNLTHFYDFIKIQLKAVIFLFLILIFFACEEVTTPPDNTGPDSPSNFILLGGGDGQARLRWSKVTDPDLQFYRLYRSVNNSTNFSIHIETVQLEYLDRFLSYDSTYYYYLVAVDYAENESLPTNIIDVQPLNISAPQPPSFLLANAINNPIENRKSIILSWLPPDAGDLDYYKIYRGTVKDFEVGINSFIDSTNIGTFFDSFTQLNQRYYYKITAVDKGKKESLPSLTSNDLILNSAVIISPSNFSKFTSPYKFQWNVVDSAKAYKVFLGSSPFSEIFWESQKVKVNETTYNGSKLTSSKVYYWWVAAYSKDKIKIENGNEIDAQINSYSMVSSFVGE